MKKISLKKKSIMDKTQIEMYKSFSQASQVVAFLKFVQEGEASQVWKEKRSLLCSLRLFCFARQRLPRRGRGPHGGILRFQ